MENQQWTDKLQQTTVLNLERADESSNNGICDNLLEIAENNVNNSKNSADNSVKDNTTNVKVVEAAISEKSRQVIQNILEQVKTLSKIEKLLLYLKLPTECNNVVDPLRQPLNPLGSRAEIHRTISWIKTHLEEDPEISLPKQDVYDEYSNYCLLNEIKPLSQADFGKVMKQVYPRVRARRLGTRGNSRYCYSGLQRRHKLDAPILPDLADKPLSTEPYCTQADLMAATWVIIKEWSESQLGNQFPSLHALACYLVLNMSVSTGSPAATLVTSFNEDQLKGNSTEGMLCTSKRKEMQLQLQRKLQQKSEHNREQKRKSQSPKTESKTRCKRSKLHPSQVTTMSQSSTSSSTSPITVAAEPVATETNTSPPQGPQPVCDKSLDYTNLQALPDFSSFQKPASCEGKGIVSAVADYMIKDNEMFIGHVNGNSSQKAVAVTGKMAIPRLNSCQSKVLPPISPKRVKNPKYKAIQPKREPCDIASYNPQRPLNSPVVESRSQVITNACKCKNQRKRKTSVDSKTSIVPISVQLEDDASITLSRERLSSVSSIDKDAMDEYLGTSNSQEHEEELLKYFKNNNTAENPEQDNSVKISQLRQLLEESMCETRILKKAQNGTAVPDVESAANKHVFPKVNFKESPQTGITHHVHPNLNSATRRRVSFDTVVHEEAVPPSPNTRRKNFSFTPISPGPHSPSGRQSKCSSTNASPFVSPRSTPVPRVRSNNHQNVLINCPTNLTVIPGSCNAPSRKTSTCKKIKQELDLSVEVNDVRHQDKKNFATMSAPPSPMLPTKLNTNLLQRLLNASNKVPYTPNYNQPQTPHSSDPLSTEISHFFTSDFPSNSDISYRSQSVPLHQMSQHIASIDPAILSQFSFDLGNSESINTVNDFTDLDTLSEAANINVNKIINALEEVPTEPLLETGSDGKILQDNLELQQSVFENMGMALNELPVASNENFEDQFSRLSGSPAGARGMGRSQSVDVDFNSGSLKFNPSRSVPNTPLPLAKIKINLAKNFSGHSSRSYPSTPLLASESFSYDQTHDYLLNGQPIKEKLMSVQENLDIISSADLGDEGMYNNMEFYNINDVNLNNDVLIDTKGNFNFDRQLSDGSFAIKQSDNAVLDESCTVLTGEQTFSGNVNGT